MKINYPATPKKEQSYPVIVYLTGQKDNPYIVHKLYDKFRYTDLKSGSNFDHQYGPFDGSSVNSWIKLEGPLTLTNE